MIFLNWRDRSHIMIVKASRICGVLERGRESVMWRKKTLQNLYNDPLEPLTKYNSIYT